MFHGVGSFPERMLIMGAALYADVCARSLLVSDDDGQRLFCARHAFCSVRRSTNKHSVRALMHYFQEIYGSKTPGSSKLYVPL